MQTSYFEFHASYDRTSLVISAIVCALLLVVAIYAGSVAAGCFAVVVIAACYAWSPRGYVLAGRDLIVRRLIGTVRMHNVLRARRATADDFSGCLRLWGSGGLFGYFGLFRTSKLGRCWWYVTDRENTIVVSAEGSAVLVSPDDVEGFLARVGDGLDSSEPSVLPGSQSGTAWLGAGIGILALAAVAGAMLYAPGPPSYTLTSTGLAIQDRLYPASIAADTIDVDAVRTVDIDIDRNWRPVARTNGFANGHYRTGWFRVAGGRTVRLYRANATRLVLLPPRSTGDPVLLEAENPDEFVERAKRLWHAR